MPCKLRLERWQDPWLATLAFAAEVEVQDEGQQETKGVGTCDSCLFIMPTDHSFPPM